MHGMDVWCMTKGSVSLALGRGPLIVVGGIQFLQ